MSVAAVIWVQRLSFLTSSQVPHLLLLRNAHRAVLVALLQRLLCSLDDVAGFVYLCVASSFCCMPLLACLPNPLLVAIFSLCVLVSSFIGLYCNIFFPSFFTFYKSTGSCQQWSIKKAFILSFLRCKWEQEAAFSLP